jgi:hypothetical protein
MQPKHSAAIAAASTVARRSILALAALMISVPGSALAQSGNEGLEIRGFASLMYARSFQDTDLDGSSFDDGNGLDFRAGFQPGDWLAFTLGYQWQTDSDYDTHYFPVGVRAYTPALAERVRFYGEGAIGIFFSRLSGDLGEEDNERAAAIQVGGGVEVDITNDWAAVLDMNYTKGLGSADDYEAGVLGVGLVYRWDL